MLFRSPALVRRLQDLGISLPERLTEQEEVGRTCVLGGRMWLICADSLVVDLLCPDNWRWSWIWDPPPWKQTMKLAFFDGTYDEWTRSKSPREVDRKLDDLRAPTYDFSLDDTRLRAFARQRAG